MTQKTSFLLDLLQPPTTAEVRAIIEERQCSLENAKSVAIDLRMSQWQRAITEAVVALQAGKP